jgi:hypothetical protein
VIENGSVGLMDVNGDMLGLILRNGDEEWKPLETGQHSFSIWTARW